MRQLLFLDNFLVICCSNGNSNIFGSRSADSDCSGYRNAYVFNGYGTDCMDISGGSILIIISLKSLVKSRKIKFLNLMSWHQCSTETIYGVIWIIKWYSIKHGHINFKPFQCTSAFKHGLHGIFE